MTDVATESAVDERFRHLYEGGSVIDRLVQLAVERPAATAARSVEASLSFSELAAAAACVAARWGDLGFRAGDRVLLRVDNVLELVPLWYGSLWAGVVPVCTVPLHGHFELAAIAAATRASGVVVQADHQRDLRDAPEKLVRDGLVGRIVTVRGGRDGSEDVLTLAPATRDELIWDATFDSAAQPGPEVLAIVQLSGGSTGVPKPIGRRRGEYWYNARCRALRWDLRPDDTVVAIGPLMHNAGASNSLHAALAAGATSGVIIPSTKTACSALQTVGATVLTTSPGVVSTLVSDPGWAHGSDQLRTVALAGARPTASLIDRLESDGITAIQDYGMSEGIMLSHHPMDSLALRRGTVGYPLSPYDEVRVLEPGSESEAADGAMGELCARGPYTITEYLDDADDQRDSFTSDGFLRTGDLVRTHLVDGIRAFTIEGRLKEIISRGGEKVAVEELEALISELPNVADAVVVPLPDDRLGQRVCVCVAPEAGATVTLEQIREFLTGRDVARYKFPEHLVVLDEIPRTAVGKKSRERALAIATGADAPTEVEQ